MSNCQLLKEYVPGNYLLDTKNYATSCFKICDLSVLMILLEIIVIFQILIAVSAN
jgi:hypothetical protein